MGGKFSNRGAAFLRSAFATEQTTLLAKLDSSRRIRHHGDGGEVNEAFFIDFLRAYLPNRYTVEKAMVLDSRGNISESIDIVVFDRQYAPTLLDSNKHRYVPAEAVYAVFECKPEISRSTLKYAGKKAASVRRLRRTSVDIHSASGNLGKKEPSPIIGGILASRVSWKSRLGDSFKSAHAALTGDRVIDCGFAADGGSFDVFEPGGAYRIGPSENALAYFAFRLLSKLQLHATTPAADWMAYADQLSKDDGAR